MSAIEQGQKKQEEFASAAFMIKFVFLNDKYLRDFRLPPRCG
jgi:hypothetical protein